jgi:cell division protein FtsN
MSRIRDMMRREAGDEAAQSGSVGPDLVADPRGPLPWLDSAPDDFNDDAVDDQPLIPRKWLLLGGLLFLGLLAGVVYAVYQRTSGQDLRAPVVATNVGVDDPRIPLIEAPKTAVREKPENPGGMQVADTDKQVYDVLDGEVVEEPTQMAQGAETPVDRPTAPPPGPVENPIPDVAPIDPPIAMLPEPKQAPVKKPEPVKPVVAKPVVKPEPPKPVAKIEPPKPKPEPVLAAPVIAASGSIYVQLGAFSSRDRAEAAWASMTGKPGLSGLSSNIQVAGADKFRLRAGPIGSRAQADAVCAQVKASGQACIVAK